MMNQTGGWMDHTGGWMGGQMTSWAVLAGGQHGLADTFKDQLNSDLLTFLKA